MSTSQQGTNRSGGVSSRVLLAIGLIAAVIFIVSLWIKADTLALITKGIPVLCLIVWLWTLPRPAPSGWQRRRPGWSKDHR